MDTVTQPSKQDRLRGKLPALLPLLRSVALNDLGSGSGLALGKLDISCLKSCEDVLKEAIKKVLLDHVELSRKNEVEGTAELVPWGMLCLSGVVPVRLLMESYDEGNIQDTPPSGGGHVHPMADANVGPDLGDDDLDEG